MLIGYGIFFFKKKLYFKVIITSDTYLHVIITTVLRNTYLQISFDKSFF